jgi:hypothetical protein
MVNLKPVYDAAVAADAKVNKIMAEMVAAFEDGTEEGKQKAMGLREELNQAQAEAKAANELYVEMRDAQSQSDEHARKFVPVNAEAADAAQKAGGPKQITRAEYEAMPAMSRGKFIHDGGSVVDELVE